MTGPRFAICQRAMSCARQILGHFSAVAVRSHLQLIPNLRTISGRAHHNHHQSSSTVRLGIRIVNWPLTRRTIRPWRQKCLEAGQLSRLCGLQGLSVDRAFAPFLCRPPGSSTCPRRLRTCERPLEIRLEFSRRLLSTQPTNTRASRTTCTDTDRGLWAAYPNTYNNFLYGRMSLPFTSRLRVSSPSSLF